MNLIDRDRRLAIVALPALRHPLAVVPDMARRFGDYRRRVRRCLRSFGLRVRFQRQQLAVSANNLVFVKMTGTQPGYEQLPEAADISHRHPSAVPIIEIPDDADAARIWRPDRKGNAIDALVYQRMCSELPVAREMVALRKQVDVDLAEYRREAIDIVKLALNASVRNSQPIAERLLAIG